jgi:hypothetical protein
MDTPRILIDPENCALMDDKDFGEPLTIGRPKSGKNAKAHESLVQSNSPAETPEFSA